VLEKCIEERPGLGVGGVEVAYVVELAVARLGLDLLAPAPALRVAALEVGQRRAPLALSDRPAHHANGVHLGVGLRLFTASRNCSRRGSAGCWSASASQRCSVERDTPA
jgi:hypothetical protein